MPTVLDVAHHSTMPNNGTFSGHETFPFRYAWLKKGVDALLQQSDIFGREDAIATLGVGKNMVRSIRHWCLATQVIEEGEYVPNSRIRPLLPTDIGRRLFMGPGWDPFLEDDASLWLLHWMLANNATRATTWYWAFNQMHEQEFTRKSFSASLARMCSERGYRISESTLTSDATCFLRTYSPSKGGATSTVEDTLDCPLTNLGLLVDMGDDRLRFNAGEKPGLPTELFTYSLLDYWDRSHSHQETLSLREITYGAGSPGRVFKLNDDAVLQQLDGIEQITCGKLSFSDTVMLRQVVRHDVIAKEQILNAHYER